MINRDGRVKAADFGTVMIAGTDEIASPSRQVGAPGQRNYAAPLNTSWARPAASAPTSSRWR